MNLKRSYLRYLRRVPLQWRRVLEFAVKNNAHWILIHPDELLDVALLPTFSFHAMQGKAGVGRAGWLKLQHGIVDVFVDPYRPGKEVLIGWREWSAASGNGIPVR